MTCEGKKLGHNFIRQKCQKCGINQYELSYPLKEKKIKLPEPEYQGKKINYEFELLGLDMMKWFEGERQSWIWSLFYKYPAGMIREAFEVCKKSRIKKLKYLIGIIKKSEL